MSAERWPPFSGGEHGHAALNIAICELLGIEWEGRPSLRVTLEMEAGRYPRVRTEYLQVWKLPEVPGRVIARDYVLVPRDRAEDVLEAPRFPRGSVRAAVARQRDHWRSEFYHREHGYSLDGETTSRAQARDLAVMQRACDREYHGSLWDARVWSGVPLAVRIRAEHGE